MWLKFLTPSNLNLLIDSLSWTKQLSINGNIDLDKKLNFVQLLNDFFEILAFNKVNFIELFLTIEKIFGQISDSMNMTELGFQYLMKLLITKLISKGVKIILFQEKTVMIKVVK